MTSLVLDILIAREITLKIDYLSIFNTEVGARITRVKFTVFNNTSDYYHSHLFLVVAFEPEEVQLKMN
jgi:hypothetical protein